MVERDARRKPNKITIEADTPEGAQALKDLEKLMESKNMRVRPLTRTNAIAGEFNPIRSLRRGLQPQE